MNFDRLSKWIVAGSMAAVLTGCGWGSRTAQHDPFLDETRVASDAAHGGPRGGASPGANAQAGQSPKYRGQPQQQQANRAAGIRNQRDIVDPFLAQKPSETAAANPPRSPATGMQAPGTQTEARTAAKPRSPLMPDSAEVADTGNPFTQPSKTPQAKTRPASDFGNPFEAADSPTAEPEEKPLARSTSPSRTSKAAPFPGMSAAHDEEESPFAAAEAKSKSKPASRTSLVGAVEEEPIPDETPETRPAVEKPARQPLPGMTVKKPFPPRVQSPEDEEIVENPFNKPAARSTKPKAAVVHEEPEETAETEAVEEEWEEEPEESTGKVRISFPSTPPAAPPAEKPTAYRRQYRPMPSEAEAGWRRRDIEEEEETP